MKIEKREVTITQDAYVADDGKEFIGEEAKYECEIYEAKIFLRTHCLGDDGKPCDTSSDVYAVYVENYEDFDKFNKISDDEGCIGLPESGVFDLYYYDLEENKYKPFSDIERKYKELKSIKANFSKKLKKR